MKPPRLSRGRPALPRAVQCAETGHQQDGGAQQHREQHNEEPVQPVSCGQIHDGAAQQRRAVENKLDQAGAAAKADVARCQAVGIALAGVLTAGEQLMLGDGQHFTDVLDQGNIRVAEPTLPFGDGGLGDKETGGKIFLGHAQFLAALEDEAAEGLFMFHGRFSFAGSNSTCKFALRICQPKKKVNRYARFCCPTVRKVQCLQGFGGMASGSAGGAPG